VVALSGSVFMVPLVGCGPLQPPEAVQLCAPLALQLKATEWPTATLLGLGTKVTVGAARVLPVSVPAALLSDEELPLQAASAAAAHPSAKRSRPALTRGRRIRRS
jgi:hypothetical protein